MFRLVRRGSVGIRPTHPRWRWARVHHLKVLTFAVEEKNDALAECLVSSAMSGKELDDSIGDCTSG